MSWLALLIDDRGHEDGNWNYTHNTNSMCNEALVRDGDQSPDTWWRMLDGRPGPEGAGLIDRIIREMEAFPDHYQAMNPPNGWGDYDGILKTLRSMRDAVPEWPTVWEVSG